MPTISVCMIVKNEQEVLARCLDSLKDIADEIIIVDTGSDDQTVQIAKKYTSNVFEFEWIDDFAMARNFSLSKASGDYLYVADADEVLDEENQQRFKQLKAVLMPEIEVVEVAYENKMLKEHNTTENFSVEFRPKLFRRLRTFYYVDPVHEVLRVDPVVFRSNVVVHHCPTGNHGGRDLGIFANLVQKGERISPRLEMMYARELMMAGKSQDFFAAAPYFKEVRSDTTREQGAHRLAACVLAHVAARKKDVEDLLQVAAPELVGTPPAEICCALGHYYLSVKKEGQAVDWYVAALSGAVPEVLAAAAGSEALFGLAACYEAAGDFESAAEYRKQAEEWRPEDLMGAQTIT